MDSTLKPFWLEFIELYRLNSCLWDVTGKDYNNKMKRNESYKVLLHKLQEAIPSATIDSLKKKINNIRTSFRREFKKVLDSKASGADPVYEPTLWYYNLLSFVGQTETQRREIDDEDDYVTDLVETKDISLMDIHVKEEDSMLGPDSPDDVAETLSETHEDDMPHNIYDAESSILPNTFLSRKRKVFSNNVNLFKQKKIANNHPVRKINDDDEFSITGKKFAFQLKRMGDRQRLIAEKLISDVMFYGGWGKLSEDAFIQLPSTRHLQDNGSI